MWPLPQKVFGREPPVTAHVVSVKAWMPPSWRWETPARQALTLRAADNSGFWAFLPELVALRDCLD